MKKEKYERVETAITEFHTEDVVMTSGIEYESHEIPIMLNK